jgi:predicted metalloprotease with PDZ domain
MNYTISASATQPFVLDIEWIIDHTDGPVLDLQLPAWRPGRYELANFAKNSMYFEAYGPTGTSLPFEKVTKDRWRIHLNGESSVKVKYGYYARQMDAGGSWVDTQQWYINFVNCLMYAEGKQDEPCQVTLQLPDSYQIACGLKQTSVHTLVADTYYQLVDCPMIASAQLQHRSYEVDGHTFHVWVQGESMPFWDRLLTDFKHFTEVQMQLMGGFPCPEYHFLLHLLPFQHYHGVEHQNSTVMTLGPAEKLDLLYAELVGLASHELFHTWNVIRIRPKELLPYDFTKENYFPTGYVAEGVTTYYGDLFLARSGFFTEQAYLDELSRTLNRHFSVANQAYLSLIQSSIDLWLDGYVAGVPNRKVSIYHKGSLAALILDLEIRKLTHDAKSLDDVMRLMWQRYGEKGIGYAHKDYIHAVADVVGQSFGEYFAACIEGTSPLAPRLAEALRHVGCTLEVRPVENAPGNLEVRIVLQEVNESLRKWLRK